MANRELFAILESRMEDGLNQQGLLAGLVEIDLDPCELTAFVPPQAEGSKAAFASAVEPPSTAYQKGF